MPFFGKKKTEKEKHKEPAVSTPSYPTAPAYPTGPSYPAAPGYPGSSIQTPPGAYSINQREPPPPYTAQAVPTLPPQMYQQTGFPPNPSISPQQIPGTSTVVVQGGFDAGARFDVTGPSIPPPPPGCLPNATQMAAAQGQNVVVTRQKDNFLTGGSDGGSVFW